MLLAAVLAFSASCSKDKDMPSPNGSTSPVKKTRAAFRSDITNWSQCTESVDLACGSFLTFRDENHFFEVYDCLERAYNHWNDSIDNAYANYTDDDYNDLWEANGWDEDQQLVDFENFYAHQSKRKALFDMEELWLTDPNSYPDPDDYDIFEDHIMNTLWSSNMNIKIGNNLIHIFPNGRILIVDNGDCQLFFSMISDSTQNNPNARMGGPIHTNPNVDPIPDCYERGFQRNYRTPGNPLPYDDFPYNGKVYATKFKVRVQTYTIPLVTKWHSLNAETKIYRPRRNDNGLKRYKTSIDNLSAGGPYLRATTCLTLSQAGTSEGRKRRSKLSTQLITRNPGVDIAIKPGQISSSFNLPALGNHTELLIIVP